MKNVLLGVCFFVLFAAQSFAGDGQTNALSRTNEWVRPLLLTNSVFNVQTNILEAQLQVKTNSRPKTVKEAIERRLLIEPQSELVARLVEDLKKQELQPIESSWVGFDPYYAAGSVYGYDQVSKDGKTAMSVRLYSSPFAPCYYPWPYYGGSPWRRWGYPGWGSTIGPIMPYPWRSLYRD